MMIADGCRSSRLHAATDSASSPRSISRRLNHTAFSSQYLRESMLIFDPNPSICSTAGEGQYFTLEA